MTPAEISEDIYACWKAGAAVAHMHMRDDDGNGTMDVNKFRETVELLRKNHPECDIVLNMTTSGDLNATDETRQAHLEGAAPRNGLLRLRLYELDDTPACSSISPKFLEELGQTHAGVGREARDRGIRPRHDRQCCLLSEKGRAESAPALPVLHGLRQRYCGQHQRTWCS